MSFGSRYILVRHVKRCWRSVATLVVLPALALSSFTSHAVLIHDHHGHDTHGHAVSLGDLDHMPENSGHRHGTHDHDGLPTDPAEDEGSPILIVLNIPDMLPGSRTSSTGAPGTTDIGTALRTLAINGCAVADGHFPVERQQTLANIPRARALVTRILLTNHTLLL